MMLPRKLRYQQTVVRIEKKINWILQDVGSFEATSLLRCFTLYRMLQVKKMQNGNGQLTGENILFVNMWAHDDCLLQMVASVTNTVGCLSTEVSALSTIW
jgi:hypothetical protein